MAFLPIKKKKTNNYNIKHQQAQKLVYNTTRWAKLRMVKLQNNPLCELCLEKDIVSATEQIHHLVPFMQGTTIVQIKYLGFDYSNLQSLCEKCHQNIHSNKNNFEE